MIFGKNLFELPLIETPVALSEEEFLALSEFRELFAVGGEYRSWCVRFAER